MKKSELAVIYVRTSPAFKERLEQAAKNDGRSLNHQIIHLLKRSMDGYTR
jgi:hypothetical protein